MRKFKLCYDKDEEEAWLQSMCAKGWAFQKFFLGVYTFAPCEPGEYTYRIDLMANSFQEQEQYKVFMREMGVEPVAQWYRWCYLRRKASEGPFELYSDVDSMIAHYSRIRRFFTGALVVEAICLLAEINGLLTTGEPLLFFFTVVILALVVVLAGAVYMCGRKIRRLREG
ncbi:MAG: DUF2812 domain-containing protein [Candidatus Pelethousia sp.]|nr:DUF2812 domain-containing protein [Candidatus Pelethousia sp.]